jgi:hypothetical protein
MDSTKMIEDYLDWKRSKELYPPQWTPLEWAHEVVMSEANVRMNLLKDMLEGRPEMGLAEMASQVRSIAYDPIEELMADGGLQVQEET